MGKRTTALIAALALATAAAACSDDGNANGTKSTTPSGASVADTTPATAPVTTAPLAPATFLLQPGTEQIAVLDAVPGEDLTVLAADGNAVATGTVDEQGSLLFRSVAPGKGYVVASATQVSEPVAVADPTDAPDASIYDDQPLLPAGGFGYITTRDGTTLSANVILPGPADAGPYPTVVEYSGYQPSDPSMAQLAQVYTTMGFAYVGVNMRGTGCSGGSFRYFETVQSLDGYDVIEAIAAQPWVMDHQVGMVGISYPGISQLFVAATQPPSLEAITPLSVLDDSYRGTLYPGGILNTGFAVQWTQERIDSAKPFGQKWTKERADAGDTRCADNQHLRLQNPDLLAEIEANPYYSSAVGDALAPITFVDKINVPVFIAGAWQDEQTGGHFPLMLDHFTSSPHVYITLTNGLHTESLSPPVFGRYAEFLQLYVGKRVPDLSVANAIEPVLAQALYGTSSVESYGNRFAGMTYADALSAFEGEPSVRVLLEQGGAPGFAPGTPEPNESITLDSWPAPDTTTVRWSLDGDGALVAGAATKPGEASYTANPTALPDTFFPGSGNDIWRTNATYDWRALPDGTGLGFVTAPLTEDAVLMGGGSVDLWVQTSVADTDLEVTISEVRPDGTEIYVQSGWLRASQRTLDDSLSTELSPRYTNLEADAADLPANEFTPLRIALFPAAHPFRAGSRLRLTIDAPGNNRPVWIFDTIDNNETVRIAFDADHPSSIVLPMMTGVSLAVAPPGCGSLRGQPCRVWAPATNGG